LPLSIPVPATSGLRVTVLASLSPAPECGRDACADRRGVGQPRKQLPQKKTPANLRSLARGHTELCIKVLAGIAQNSTSDAARVSAAALLLERGWGKAPQPVTSDEDGGPIVVEIIQRVREK
jgi:hypothetical protein